MADARADAGAPILPTRQSYADITEQIINQVIPSGMRERSNWTSASRTSRSSPVM